MKPAPFEYHRPSTLQEATSLLAELGDGAKVIAGGQSLVPMLALRLAVFEHLIDLRRVPGLDVIARSEKSLSVGATVTESQVESSDDVAEAAPLLARATPLIGHFQIRNRGTIGGSLAHADPAAEYPAVALALDAEFDTESIRGPRTIPAAAFFTGLWSTGLAADEILIAVRFPTWVGRCGFAIEEFSRRHGDFAIAGAGAAVELDSGDRIKRCGLGLIGLGSTPVRPSHAEAELIGRPVDEIDATQLGQLAVSKLDCVPSDLHGSSDYRTRVGAAMLARAWASACEEARSDG